MGVIRPKDGGLRAKAAGAAVRVKTETVPNAILLKCPKQSYTESTTESVA